MFVSPRTIKADRIIHNGSALEVALHILDALGVEHGIDPDQVTEEDRAIIIETPFSYPTRFGIIHDANGKRSFALFDEDDAASEYANNPDFSAENTTKPEPVAAPEGSAEYEPQADPEGDAIAERVAMAQMPQPAKADDAA